MGYANLALPPVWSLVHGEKPGYNDEDRDHG